MKLALSSFVLDEDDTMIPFRRGERIGVDIDCGALILYATAEQFAKLAEVCRIAAVDENPSLAECETCGKPSDDLEKVRSQAAGIEDTLGLCPSCRGEK